MEMSFFGSQIKSKAALWTYNGIQAKKILLIIQASTMISSTIKYCTHVTYKKTTICAYYHTQQSQVLCEGVLELYPMDTTARVHSPE